MGVKGVIDSGTLLHVKFKPQLCAASAGTFAAMAMLYMLFAKTVPIISIWELKAKEHPTSDHAPALAQTAEEGAD